MLQLVSSGHGSKWKLLSAKLWFQNDRDYDS
jgi:hypothetical protein